MTAAATSPPTAESAPAAAVNPFGAGAPLRRRTDRPRALGKFLWVGDEKLYVRGVTYGPLRAGAGGGEYGEPDLVEADLDAIAGHGFNAIRTYTVPPHWLLDAAHRAGLWVMAGLPWEQHVAFLEDRRTARAIERRVREGVRACAGHPAVLAYAVGNEIPTSIVRWHGRRRVERFLERLSVAAREEDPEGLVTYANYPSTEYLELPWADLFSFNVYLEDPSALDSYLPRLHNVAGDRPVIIAELGLDSRRNGVRAQSEVVSQEIRSAFSSGCTGVFVFSWTDEWHRGGQDIVDWGFGLTDRSRSPRPALAAVAEAFQGAPFPGDIRWPRVSVVVCSLNGAHRIRECLEALRLLDYPDYEVIVVNDGSTDSTATIASEYGYRVITTENRGLSSARNTGLQLARGDIVAYIDDDAYPDPDWLRYLAYSFITTDHVGIGGPNIPPGGDGLVAEAVASAPGGPTHVLLSDEEAEHIPGCNMAFRRAALEEIGGFDPRFRVAGDDVDICWRVRERGWTSGYNPAAVVWHHRRSSIREFWKQQRGYGVAEGLLERKWPKKYNVAGQARWTGRVYGPWLGTLTSRGGRIYQGTWGGAPFQSVQPGRPSRLWLLEVPEWYLWIAAVGALSLVGVVWSPLLALLPLTIMALTASLIVAGRRARHSISSLGRRSATRRVALWLLTTFLHVVQPVARLGGRLAFGLTPWRRRTLNTSRLAVSRTHVASTERWRSLPDTLQGIERALEAAGAVVLRGSAYDSWDVEVRSGAIGGVRLLMTVEEHDGGRQLRRFRWWPRFHGGWVAISGTLLALSIAAGLGQEWIASGLLLCAAMILVAGVVRQCIAASGVVAAVVRSAP
jgi:O-antigen biosynthesis protein